MTPFRLIDAHSVVDAAELLRTYGGDAQPIAGGGDLLGLLKEGISETHAVSKVLVNLATAGDLKQITPTDDGLRIGGMVTLAQLRRHPDSPPLLAEAIERIASPQLRVRTTLGGNLLQRPRCVYFRHPDIPCFKKGGESCPGESAPAEVYPGALYPGRCHASHPSDLAPALIALGAVAEITGPDGVRMLPLADLYRKAAFNWEREADMAHAELLTSIRLPYPIGAQAFEKVALRKANEFAQASASVVIETNGARIVGARVVLGGIAQAPVVCERADALLVGNIAGAVDLARVARDLVTFEYLTEANEPRAAMCRLAIERGLARALQRERS